jgi:hypothetical protein
MLGEILTTKGKDSDPSTTAITTVSRDAAVLMLGMAKRNYSWDSWKTQGKVFLVQYFLLDCQLLMFHTTEKSICGLRGR